MMDKSKTPPIHLGSCRNSNFVRRGFGFVHHSIAILYHEVPNLISRFATFSSQYGARATAADAVRAAEHQHHARAERGARCKAPRHGALAAGETTQQRCWVSVCVPRSRLTGVRRRCVRRRRRRATSAPPPAAAAAAQRRYAAARQRSQLEGSACRPPAPWRVGAIRPGESKGITSSRLRSCTTSATVFLIQRTALKGQTASGSWRGRHKCSRLRLKPRASTAPRAGARAAATARAAPARTACGPASRRRGRARRRRAARALRWKVANREIRFGTS